MAERVYHVYILASQRNGTLYIGVTNDLARRMWQHRTGAGSKFAARYRRDTSCLVRDSWRSRSKRSPAKSSLRNGIGAGSSTDREDEPDLARPLRRVECLGAARQAALDSRFRGNDTCRARESGGPVSARRTALDIPPSRGIEQRTVVPAKAGTLGERVSCAGFPAFAGMTGRPYPFFGSTWPPKPLRIAEMIFSAKVCCWRERKRV